jgi:hypothetical protein
VGIGAPGHRTRPESSPSAASAWGPLSSFLPEMTGYSGGPGPATCLDIPWADSLSGVGGLSFLSLWHLRVLPLKLCLRGVCQLLTTDQGLSLYLGM